MTERSEALAQLSRILGDGSLRSASLEEARKAVRTESAKFLDGLVAEAARSDDVFDRESAMLYIEQRLVSLSELIDKDLKRELCDGAREQIEKW
jgi:hypothetical protein